MSNFTDQPQGYVPHMGYMPPEDPYALRVSFGKRLGAAFLDFAFLIIISFILGLFLTQAQPPQPTADADMDQILDLMMQGFQAQLPAYFVTLAYALIEGLTGASPGKHILGITVAHDNRSQGAIGVFLTRFFIKNASYIVVIIGVAAGNWALLLVGMALSFFYIAGCFFALGEKKQALHDILAKTAIFHKSDVLPSSATA